MDNSTINLPQPHSAMIENLQAFTLLHEKWQKDPLVLTITGLAENKEELQTMNTDMKLLKQDIAEMKETLGNLNNQTTRVLADLAPTESVVQKTSSLIKKIGLTKSSIVNLDEKSLRVFCGLLEMPDGSVEDMRNHLAIKLDDLVNEAILNEWAVPSKKKKKIPV